MYEPPQMKRLGELQQGHGGAACSDGSGDQFDCMTGNTAVQSCYSDGNSAGYQCGTGNAGGA